MSSYNRLTELSFVADRFERDVDISLIIADNDFKKLRSDLVDKYSEEGIRKVEERERNKRNKEYAQY